MSRLDPLGVSFLPAVISRELAGCRHVAVGSDGAMHAAGALLAQALHGEPRVTILGSRAQLFFSDGGRELFEGVHLISVQKVTVRASPQSEDWRGVCSRGERKCLSRFEFLLVS